MPASARAIRTYAPRLLLVAAATSLAACEVGRRDVGDSLGFTLESPSPFNVVPRAPLRLPPNMAELPLPQPGATSPLEPQPRQAARAALANAGQPEVEPLQPSPGELALRNASGAAQVDPNIRDIVQSEVGEGRQSQYGATSILGLEVPDGSEDEILLPREEAARIEQSGGNAPNPAPLAEPPPQNEIELRVQERPGPPASPQ